MNEKMPLKEAFLWITYTLLLVSGTATFAFCYYMHFITQRKLDPKYTISAIVQSRMEGPVLKNSYLTEILGLSVDAPMNLYRLRSDESVRKLQASPLIRKAEIKKIKPSTVFVQYTSRQPIGIVGEYSNTAMDEEGFLFPYQPHLEIDPKTIPTVYLGIEEVVWGNQLAEPKVELAIKLLKDLKSDKLKLVDVSQAFALSSGKRQIVVVFSDGYEHTLRLKTEEYLSQLTLYEKLKKRLEQNKVIDLRIPQLAYISGDKESTP